MLLCFGPKGHQIIGVSTVLSMSQVAGLCTLLLDILYEMKR